MADEFQATGIIGGNWWNMTSSRTSSLGPSPCSAALSGDHIGSYGWSTATDAVMNLDMKQQARSSTTSDDNDDDRSASGCDNSMVMGFQDSSLQMFGFGLSSSSPTSDWNHQTSNLISHGGGRSGSNYNSMLQDDIINLRPQNYEHHDQIQTDWNSKHFAAITDDSTIITCQGLPTTNSYNIYPSSIVQSLFEPDDHEAQPQQPVFDNYHSSANFQTTSSNDFSPSWLNSSPSNFIKPSTQRANHFLYSNNAPYAIHNNVRASFTPSQNMQFHNSSFEEKPNCVNLTGNKRNNDLHVSTTKKPSNEPAFKRSRVETPSPLPNFKVRKEKLGDRITALQQLVSPFGKTDTASVLHEAIEYIKFLHDQVSVLSTSYMKNSSQNIQHQQTSSHKIKDSEGSKQDLRSRGLCLVPISSTYPVANETIPDFWTPTFGGTFR